MIAKSSWVARSGSMKLMAMLDVYRVRLLSLKGCNEYKVFVMRNQVLLKMLTRLGL